MTYTATYDEFLTTDRTMDIEDLPPFQFRKEKDEKGTLDWLVRNFDNNEKTAHSRRLTYRRYQAMYKNIQWKSFDARDTRRDSETLTRRPRHSVNFIREMVDNRVAQNSRMKHNLAFIPAHDEQSDVNNAKLCKLMYDGYAEENSLELKHKQMDHATFLFGHSIMYITWDSESGPFSPKYEELKNTMDKKEIKKVLGKEEIRIGDVQIDILGPDRWYPEPNKCEWMELDYIETVDYVHIDELKAKYPNKSNKIMENEREIFNFDNSELTRPKNLIVVRCFWHKPTKFFPEGCKIVYTDDVILEWNDYPYDHAQLPAVPDKDVEIYGEFWGRSFLADIEQMQRFYNAMQSAQARDFSWASAPKWMMPKGSTNVHSLGNDISVVEFSGPIAPVLVTPSYTPPASLELQDRIKKQISQHSKVYDISRGEVPSGVTANSALRFLDEQESQVIQPQQAKRKNRVVKVGKMILELFKQYYKAGDGRTVRKLGEKNEYLIRSMEKANFSRVYDVRVQNTSALPDTKTGKIAAIIDLNTATQTDPIFRKEEIVQMLDLGNDDYFKDRATVAVDAANTAFDAILEGEFIEPPRITDELLVHYAVFTKGIQQFSFKEKVDENIQQQVGSYIKALELLMWERCRINMKFCATVLELDNYPMYFKPSMPISKIMALHQLDLQGSAIAPEQEGIDTTKVEKSQEMRKDAAEKEQ